jgi:pyridoxal phosphate enzyme (YggS family)
LRTSPPTNLLIFLSPDGVPNLACVEAVDSPKLASKLDAAVAAALTAGLRPAAAGPLAVMVQVNTSGEVSKHGVAPADAPALALHVASACPCLRLAGLMTIGQPDYTSRPENFACLADTRAAIVAALAGNGASITPLLELSMGMSGDFEAAIGMGSTNVRVGSTIFGARE